MKTPINGESGKPVRKLTNSEKAEFESDFAPRLRKASKGFQVSTSKQLEIPGAIAEEILRFERHLSSALPGLQSNG